MSAVDTGESAADKERREDKRLNNLVAVTVVLLTVFMAITKTKDDNINQAMQKAKADSVDAWAEYQFARVKLTLEPKFFPANEVPAAKCVIALREQGRMADAIRLAHAVLAALWAEEKNTGDPATLRAIIAGCGLDAIAVIKASEAPAIAEKRDTYTKQAIERGVFGAPSFVIDGEIFWGQDRLDFVDRKLAA